MHMVHWNTKYQNFNEATNKPDGLLVFSVLFHASVRENPLLDPIIDYLPNIIEFGSKVDLGEEDEFALISLLPSLYQTFYRYKGSLTTPPCTESVTWLVVAGLESIGYSQLFEFSKLDNRENRLIGNTNRNLQDLNSRRVEVSSNKHCFRRHDRGGKKWKIKKGAQDDEPPQSTDSVSDQSNSSSDSVTDQPNTSDPVTQEPYPSIDQDTEDSPTMTIDNEPSLSYPSFSLPSFSLPSFKLPTFRFPTFRFPEFSFDFSDSLFSWI